ncbi:MAG: mechanosensitive ion channel family protein [Rivularia sp. (in: Bacteria)]|nr:mechanosensitive ion channel family protein [Rivularia sp. MS3]
MPRHLHCSESLFFTKACGLILQSWRFFLFNINSKIFIKFQIGIVLATFVMLIFAVSPVQAQIPTLSDLKSNSIIITNHSKNELVSACIRLDGRCLFKIADPKSELSQRIEDIEQRLYNSSNMYFQTDSAQLKIRQQATGNLQDIYISVEDKEVRLLTVTPWDAQFKGVSIEVRTNQIIQKLKEGLQRAKQERKPRFLINQGLKAAGITVVIFFLNCIIFRKERHLKNSKKHLTSSNSSEYQPILTQLNRRQQWNITEVQHRLLQIIQAAIWIGGTLFIFDLFPYTRIIGLWFFTSLSIPLQIGLVGCITYVLICFSYALISRLNSILAKNYLVTQKAHDRLQLRMTTISEIARGIVTISWFIVGVLVAFLLIGVDINPFLAGAGIIGLGLSLASQNLIKDVINGFLIVLEDQYAVGDFINVGEVGGIVETMNLRITQLRNSEGELIAVPNSEIKIVRNLSNTWARANLEIPVSYHTDVDRALELITQVAEQMSQDAIWQKSILEPPNILGVDSFSTQGIIVRVWFKTKPLQQWNVSREFRRRIKIACDESGIPIGT